MMPAGTVRAPSLRGVGLLTGWGEGLPAIESRARDGSGGLVTVPTPAVGGERFRRATRECLLAVAAVQAALADAGLPPDALAGERTGILYASATAYAAANRAFLQNEGSTLHFPYTAPSAVPGEVTIEYGIRGPYVNLMGGGTAALQGLWYAARWFEQGIVDRVALLAVETVHEVRDLLERVRRLYDAPLVEGAICLLLEAGRGGSFRWASSRARRRPAATVARVLDAVLGSESPTALAAVVSGAARRLGQTEAAELLRRGIIASRRPLGGPGEALACGPLIGLASARGAGRGGPCLFTATWRDDYGAAIWPPG